MSGSLSNDFLLVDGFIFKVGTARGFNLGFNLFLPYESTFSSARMKVSLEKCNMQTLALSVGVKFFLFILSSHSCLNLGLVSGGKAKV